MCLNKWLHFLEDTQGRESRLHYVRDKEKREVDFAVVESTGLRMLMEVKRSDASVSGALAHFAKKLRPAEAVQLVETAARAETAGGIRVCPAAEWLDSLDA